MLLDLHINPQKYLPSMIYMNRKIEKYNNKLIIGDNIKSFKMYSILPLRSSIIPKYIPIDTTIILDILIEKGITDLYKTGKNKEEIWKYSFKNLFNKKNKDLLKNNKYKFNDLIYTDGFVVSITQIKKGTIKTNYMVKSSKPKKGKKTNEFDYIDEFTDKQLKDLTNYNLVGVDPGKRNILAMIDKDRSKLSYTSIQRRFECHKNNKKKIDKIRDDNIKALETEISGCNSKACSIKNFKEYIKKKNEINDKLFNFYENKLFRKCKRKAYINTQKSEAKLVNKIKETFQKDNKKICLAYGNWSQPKQMRNYFPTPSIGIKRMLCKHFKMVTVDEFKTSKLCACCSSENEKFQMRDNPKPYKTGSSLVHSLLRCKNVNCNKFWDRDVNGSTNILKIATNYIINKCRLDAFKR